MVEERGRAAARASRDGDVLLEAVGQRKAAAAKEVAALERAIADAGGRLVTVRDPAQIEPAFRDILAELHAQYALGYDPYPRRNDGTWRDVDVEVLRPGLRVRAPAGYLDR